jgi:hypothetical protein
MLASFLMNHLKIDHEDEDEVLSLSVSLINIICHSSHLVTYYHCTSAGFFIVKHDEGIRLLEKIVALLFCRILQLLR